MSIWLKGFALSCVAVVAPAKPLFIAALVLVAIDSISGMLAARKRGEKITSAGMRRTISKSFIYTLAILAAFVAEKYLLESLLPVSKLVAGAIGTVEIVSTLENFNTVLGGSIFKAILGKLGSPNDQPSQQPPPSPVKND